MEQRNEAVLKPESLSGSSIPLKVVKIRAKCGHRVEPTVYVSKYGRCPKCRHKKKGA